jgi:uncharacterized protein YkwD
VFQAHHAGTADVKQVTDLEHERVLVLVELPVRVGDLPEHADDRGFFLFGQIVVQQLREFVQGHEFFSLVPGRMNKLRSFLRLKAEMRLGNRQQVLEFGLVKHLVCERNIKHKNGRCLADRAGTPICVALSRLRRRKRADDLVKKSIDQGLPSSANQRVVCAACPDKQFKGYDSIVMHPKFFISGAIIVVLSVAPVRGIADVVDTVNSIRLQGCAELPAVNQPLRARAQLEEAARRVAQGDGLETATSESGYRARTSASIRIRTTNGDNGMAEILAQRFCKIVADKSLREIGVFRRGDETWMVLATPLSPPAREDAATAGQRVLDLINDARSHARRCGRKRFRATTPLKHAAALEHAARVHARDMAARNFLGHVGSDESMPAERATQAGYSWASVAENVAAGQTTAAEVVNTWLASPGHCANLMDPRYSESAAARATNPESEQVVYWVQMFAAPD